MKKTQWQTHVDAFNKSGLSKRGYAEKHQLVYHQFVYWSQKLNKAPSKVSPNEFIPVTVAPVPTVTTKPKPKPAMKPQTTQPLGILEFPNGIRLVIHSPELLAQLPSLLSTPLDQELNGNSMTGFLIQWCGKQAR